MKKALFLALSLAFLLTACGETTLPDTSEQNPVDNTQETSLPESCLLYYDLGNVSILAEDKSLPLAQNAGDGYATSYSVWYDGEYQDLALQDGDSGISVADMTGGSAVFDYGAGIGQTYGKTMMESCEIGTRLAASVITTGENVCPRYLPSEFGLDVSAPDDAQLALEL